MFCRYEWRTSYCLSDFIRNIFQPYFFTHNTVKYKVESNFSFTSTNCSPPNHKADMEQIVFFPRPIHRLMNIFTMFVDKNGPNNAQLQSLWFYSPFWCHSSLLYIYFDTVYSDKNMVWVYLVSCFTIQKYFCNPGLRRSPFSMSDSK